MNAIVSVTQNWAIGKDGRLLIHNRADMRHFVELTGDGIVVMGRKTFESLPAGPLKGRTNLVLTRQFETHTDNLQTFDSPEALLKRLEGEDPERVWLIGGSGLYRLFLPHTTRAYVTMHECIIDDADAYFPNLDKEADWELVDEEYIGVCEDGYEFSYRLYNNKAQL